MKLTTGQLDILYGCFCRLDGGVMLSLEAVCKEYLKMIAESRTHCLIAAPEGRQIASTYKGPDSTNVYFSPIPKPCPVPVLNPVTVTVEDIYGHVPLIPEGYVAEFGELQALAAKGFTDALSIHDGKNTNPIKAYTYPGTMVRICLKKYEG